MGPFVYFDSVDTYIGDQCRRYEAVLSESIRNPCIPAMYDDAEGRMFFGTTRGDLRVRFNDAESIIIDVISAWLAANDLKDPV